MLWLSVPKSHVPRAEPSENAPYPWNAFTPNPSWPPHLPINPFVGTFKLQKAGVSQCHTSMHQSWRPYLWRERREVERGAVRRLREEGMATIWKNRYRELIGTIGTHLTCTTRNPSGISISHHVSWCAPWKSSKNLIWQFHTRVQEVLHVACGNCDNLRKSILLRYSTVVQKKVCSPFAADTPLYPLVVSLKAWSLKSYLQQFTSSSDIAYIRIPFN